MRIVFMGTPEFSTPSLQALIDSTDEVVGVFTQPDRPKGRGGKVQMSPVKQLAMQYDIPVFQPKKIRVDGLADLQKLAPDLCVTAAFGQILSQATLDVPKIGTVNVHASLLPRHRGSSPVNWAILQDDAVTGVTTMLTDAGIDTGDMLLKREVSITDQDTAGSLLEKLSCTGAALLVETVQRLKAGNCSREKQTEADMTYDPMLNKEMGLLNFSHMTRALFCQVRALNPWPCAYAQTTAGMLKVWGAKPYAFIHSAAPGTVLVADAKQGLVIATGDGAIELTEIQAPNSKRMPAKTFLLGRQIAVNTRLEEATI
ncbi:MAG TPA: methionyl-tRNA formyltransferase [Candidatus Limiplasma sp.]|nr:methionyl-tRNA formyltransferase [Candidatus Limiplasma sp.]